MHFSTYGNALLLLRVSESLDVVQELINMKEGNLRAASEELMDLYKMRKRNLEAFHSQNHPKYFFHVLDEQLKLIFRTKGKRFTFTHTDMKEEQSLFPLIEFKRIKAALPEGVFRADYVRGPLSSREDTNLEDIHGCRWVDNPFNLDLVQFNPDKTTIRTDNQVIFREFIINDQSRIQQS